MFICCLAISVPVWGQSATPDKINPAQLETLEDAQKAATQKAKELAQQSQRLDKDLFALKKDLVSTAAETETYEKAVRNIEDKLSDIEDDKSNIRKKIFHDRTTLSGLLGALQNIHITPPPISFTSAKDTIDHIHTRHLMAGVSRNLKIRADNLSQQLTTLDNLQSQTQTEQKKLASTETALSKKRRHIKSLVDKKNDLKKSLTNQTKSERARAKQLASEAASLRDLISKFERAAKDIAPRVKPERYSTRGSTIATIIPRLKPRAGQAPQAVSLPPGTQRFSDARGQLRSPVSGRLKTSYGGKHKGITVSTRSGAQVISPYSGRVEFSGPFKNYDNVIILNVGGGYFILMTGLDKIHVKTGETLESGEPVGNMPKNGSKKGELYIEFRKNGTPVNPKPWLGTRFAQSKSE